MQTVLAAAPLAAANLQQLNYMFGRRKIEQIITVAVMAGLQQ